jgi:hypothetical protein
MRAYPRAIELAEAADGAVGSRFTGHNKARCPSSRTSGTETDLKAITGVPQAIASIMRAGRMVQAILG